MTPLGRGVLATGIGAWFLAGALGWLELRYIAVAATALVLFASAFLVAPASLEIRLDVEPSRVSAGTPVAGSLGLRNGGRGRLLPLEVDLPVGAVTPSFPVPSLAPGASHEELFVVPTSRRAVIRVGPAAAVRADPLGLMRREVVSRTTTDIYVRPRTTPLEPFSAGLLRDLEGQSTRDISTSDLAFHALREYTPGDDRRYVHWRSSAKADRLMVRQFLDTRRSVVSVALDCQASHWTRPDDFELGVSIAGSVALRALNDGLDTALCAASRVVQDSSPHSFLDLLAGVELADYGGDLTTAAHRTARAATDTSLAILITGDVVPFTVLRGAARLFGADVSVLVVRVEPSAPSGLQQSAGLTVLAVRQLSDLRALLMSRVSA